MLARQFQRRDHVRRARTPRDKRRPVIDRAVPDPAVVVIARIGGRDQGAFKAFTQSFDRRFGELHLRQYEPSQARPPRHVQ